MRATALGILFLLVAPIAWAAEPAPRVQLTFSFYLSGGPQYAACSVPIVEGWSLRDLLNEATNWCIDSWSYASGTIECIDEICRSWSITVDGEPPSDALWRTHLSGGEEVELVYFGLLVNVRDGFPGIQSRLNYLNNS